MSIGVGDAGFRQKSSAKMRGLIDDENCTVLIVSHDMNTLRKLCNRMLWMRDGVTQAYAMWMRSSKSMRFAWV